MSRGMYTEELKTKYGINNVRELRLIPYVQYCLINQEAIDPWKITSEEEEILSNWQNKGYLTYSMSEPLTVSKEFWDLIHDILYDTYVLHLTDEEDYKNEKRRTSI